MTQASFEEIAWRISDSRCSIYDAPVPTNSDLYYPLDLLEAALSIGLVGQQWNVPARTRSKLGKSAVAEALGYSMPSSFTKTQPRFPHQNLDVFFQQSSNLQIWNEEVDPARRYAICRMDEENFVTAVRVVTGETIALWDRTGTLTTKFQAKRRPGFEGSVLVSEVDTVNFASELLPCVATDRELNSLRPAAQPISGHVLPIAKVHDRLLLTIGISFPDPGITNERARGAVLQQIAYEALQVGEYGDTGQFPDILNQALEVKLQLAPTVDLGLVSPDSTAVAETISEYLQHRDIRYSVFFASRNDGMITLDSVVTTTGADFFNEFRRFEGQVMNKKLQIPIPSGLFDTER